MSRIDLRTLIVGGAIGVMLAVVLGMREASTPQTDRYKLVVEPGQDGQGWARWVFDSATGQLWQYAEKSNSWEGMGSPATPVDDKPNGPPPLPMNDAAAKPVSRTATPAWHLQGDPNASRSNVPSNLDIQGLVDAGYLKRLSIEPREAWVDPHTWANMRPDGQHVQAALLSRYIASKRDGEENFIVVIDHSTGKELAAWSLSGGFSRR